MKNTSVQPRPDEIGLWLVTARRAVLLLGVTAGFVFLAVLLAGGARADERSADPSGRPAAQEPASGLPGPSGRPGEAGEPAASAPHSGTAAGGPAIKPVIASLHSATAAVSPVIEPVASALRPVAEATAPIVEPLASAVSPVTGPLVRPVIGALSPLLETVGPVLRPVVAPIVGAAEPIVTPISRALGTEPVIGAVTSPRQHPDPIGPRADVVTGAVAGPSAWPSSVHFGQKVETATSSRIGATGPRPVIGWPEMAASMSGQGVPQGPSPSDTACSTGTATLSGSGQHGGAAAILAARPGIAGAQQHRRAPPAGAWPSQRLVSAGENRPG
ncbi:hypothetical protein [Amycolatopsis saalfeldensis]|uniref:Uncharacterized protein n=1 Tax=Amycolatopsis saalfeldensis TaxID=394193 RepID=A0A1H8YP55_9PSEU|nr:hypothetical protein [Amycolatopsis saalfeldensis]SEP53158.1 hypothetical protein SAMN04489732_124129 [Amycolatopsis saalfeldensis]